MKGAHHPYLQLGELNCEGRSSRGLLEQLSLEAHLNAISRKVGRGIGVMKRAKPFVPDETMHTIYKALIQPYFDYCSPLWDNCGLLLKEKLQKFQNRVARVLTGADYDTSSSELLEQLRWKNLETKHKSNKAVLVYNILNNGILPRVFESFSERSVNENGYNLGNYDTDLSIPRHKKELLKRSFKSRGAVLWNSLSREAKSAQSIHCFKRLINSNI